VNPSTTHSAHPDDGVASASDALLAAFRAVLRPLARLAVAGGLPYPRIDETVREALVDAALAAHPDLPATRRVSRISTALVLNRREVARLTPPRREETPPRPSPAIRLFLRWRSDRRLRDATGEPLLLPRAGGPRSFERLATEITRDVHPRSLLVEMIRLGLVHHDESHDTVELVADAFVPRDDRNRMLGFLGANVGDHLEAAVTNVLGGGNEHFEQAIFADELSEESIRQFRDAIQRQWRAMLESMAPELEALIEADRRAGRAQDRRIRIGLFSFTGPMDEPGATDAGAGSRAETVTGTVPQKKEVE
jgi:hypothetical protein